MKFINLLELFVAILFTLLIFCFVIEKSCFYWIIAPLLFISGAVLIMSKGSLWSFREELLYKFTVSMKKGELLPLEFFDEDLKLWDLFYLKNEFYKVYKREDNIYKKFYIEKIDKYYECIHNITCKFKSLTILNDTKICRISYRIYDFNEKQFKEVLKKRGFIETSVIDSYTNNKYDIDIYQRTDGSALIIIDNIELSKELNNLPY